MEILALILQIGMLLFWVVMLLGLAAITLILTSARFIACTIAICLLGGTMFLLGGCVGATYLDVSAGPQIDPIVGGGSNWDGDGPIVEIALRKEWERGVFCQFVHTSNLGSGPPFNSDQETTLDRVTCGKSFRLR